MLDGLKWHVLGVLVAGLLAGASMTLLNYGTTYLLLGQDREPHRSAIAEAYDQGVLDRGSRCDDLSFCHENECIILTSLLLDYSSPIEEMQVMRYSYGSHCAELYKIASGETGRARIYDRYLNGWRIFYFFSIPLPLGHRPMADSACARQGALPVREITTCWWGKSRPLPQVLAFKEDSRRECLSV